MCVRVCVCVCVAFVLHSLHPHSQIDPPLARITMRARATAPENILAHVASVGAAPLSGYLALLARRSAHTQMNGN